MPNVYDPSKDPKYPVMRGLNAQLTEAEASAQPTPPYNPNRDIVEGVATVSPTGAPVIPPKAVPFLLLGAGLAQVIGDEVANPAPWTLSRGIGLAVKVLSFLALGASPGLRRR